MREHYDFSKARSGEVVSNIKKERITIRLDPDVINWFKDQVHQAGGGNYQTLINEALHKHIESQKDTLLKTLRKVIREELKRANG